MERKTSGVRRQEIVASTLRLMIKNGIGNSTINNIAKANNISEAAIYRHFKDKRAILTGLIEYFENNLLDAISRPSQGTDDPIITLQEIMRNHMKLVQKNRGIFFAIIAESMHFNDVILKRRILEVIEKYKNKITAVLIEARNKKLIKNNLNYDEVSLALFGLVQTAIIQSSLTNFKVPPMRRLNTLWNIFIDGIRMRS
jgi:AcrR family transcriptional regulator